MAKDSLVMVKDIDETIEDFSAVDRNNINFWLSQLERYSPEKVISICLQVGTTRKIAEEIADEIDKYADSRIRMSEIRPLIFSLLREKDPSAARRFRAGEIYVRTSSQTFERFSRDKIVESLLTETNISREDAEKIGEEVEKFVRNANLDYISSSLIRELVNAKLIEHGLEDVRRMYTRVGLPVYDITKLINEGTKENANLQYNPETIHKLMGDQMIKEYTLTKILPRDLANAHINGQVHIHDLDYFPMRPFCFSHDIRFFLRNGFKPDGTGDHATIAGPAKTPEVAFLHAAKVLAAAQTNCAGGQGFSYFNTFLAPVIKGLSYKQVKQLAQMFVFEMGQMYVARGGQTVFSSIDLDMTVPKMFRDIRAVELGGKLGDNTYGDYEDEVRTLFNAFLDIYLEGDYQGKPFNFPKFEVQIYPKFLKNGKFDEELMRVSELAAKFGTPYYIINQPYMPEFACYQCCAYLMPLDKSIDTSNLEEEVIRGGSLQVVTINLPQIAYEARGEDGKFFEILEERMEKAKRVMLLRHDIIEKNLRNGMLPFLSQKVNEKERYFEPDKQSYTIGLVGINEMTKFHTGEELHESKEAWMFGLRVMKYMKEVVVRFREETNLNFALARTPAESTAHRLALIDRKIYGDKAIVQGDLKTNSIYYTNSFHVRPNADIPLFERMKIEGSFHPLTDGGAMSHIWLGEAHPNPEAIMN
ncbi:MAG TPA: anaerobic ribonucleoside-triphosphate reductase, partial [Candidatus Aenigmarchaeota archaeon]|nr:anaerobic ribonucleoside-triphosphate reductase [Candidatus Aenigmarchaeota archaeon]